MPVKKKSDEKKIYQLKVTLREIKPPIWRRLLVPHDMHLHQLHRVLQIVMGWTDSHLHEFIIDRESYGDRSLSIDMGHEMANEKLVRLYRAAPAEKSKFLYVYDLGDCWEHEILVEKILPLEKRVRYPLCVKGKRACPPEDCGGVPGYYDLLESLKDPSHPEHDRMFDWLPGDFDSERLDIEQVNTKLADFKL